MNARPLDIADFLELVLSALDSAGVAYLIGGAIAGWAWGEPRATQDLDLVVDIPIEAVNRLSDELKARDMLVPAEIILDALTENRADAPINAIHLYSGLKADLYPLRAGDELRQEAFQRRQQVDFGPPIGTVYVHSPEDLILNKLLFFSIHRQPKHVRDINAILRAMQGQLDMALIDALGAKVGVVSSLGESQRVKFVTAHSSPLLQGTGEKKAKNRSNSGANLPNCSCFWLFSPLSRFRERVFRITGRLCLGKEPGQICNGQEYFHRSL